MTKKKMPVLRGGEMSKEMRARYERALAEREKATKPLHDAISDSERITAEDLALRVGPCSALLEEALIVRAAASVRLRRKRGKKK